MIKKVAFLMIISTLTYGDTLGFKLGLNSPTSNVTVTGTDRNGGPSIMVGVEALKSLKHVDVGVDVSLLKRSEFESRVLVNNFVTNVSGESLVVLPMVRYVFRREASFNPYIGAGVGIAKVKTTGTARPAAGYLWSDTLSTETRTIVNESKTSAAYSIRIGFDYKMTDSFSLGYEASYNAQKGVRSLSSGLVARVHL